MLFLVRISRRYGPSRARGGSWTLLTGHGHVLVEIARNPGARIRDISAAAGITERTVQAIVADLEAAGYLTRTRTGRRTWYTVNPDSSFRHPAQEGLRVGPFLAAALPQPRLTTTTLDLAPRALSALVDRFCACLGAGVLGSRLGSLPVPGNRAMGKEVIAVSQRDKGQEHRPGSQGQGQTGSWEGGRESVCPG